MHGFWSGSAVAAVALGLACTDPVPQPVTTGAKDTSVTTNPMLGEQAEVSIVQAGGLFPSLVSGFNDFSVDSHFIYGPSLADPQTRQVTRGVSLMGWSTSLDAGATYTYHGKVSPPPGWSAIWGDPSLAVDPNNAQVVYYVQMGASDDSWNSVTGNQQVTSLSPGRDIVDGFCIARSTDEGISFGEVSCHRVGTGPASVDRTAVSVDSSGRVYVAQNTTSGGSQTGSVVFQSVGSWNNFQLLPTPPFSGLSEPSLFTDPSGDVWFAARSGRGSFGEDVNLGRWPTADTGWDNLVTPTQNCAMQLAFSDPNYASGRKFRNSHTYALGIAPDELGQLVLRGGWQLNRGDTANRDYIQFFEIPVGASSCFAPTTWSTFNDSGRQFQISLDHHNRGGSVSTGGAGTVWWGIYRTTQGVADPTQPFVWTQAVQVSKFGVSNRNLISPQFVTQRSSFVCPRHENGSPDYYGDYIGITQIRDTSGLWWAVANYSYSANVPPCDAQTPFLGRPTNIWSSRW